ncbi:glucose dehydrogenase [FAD, quinone]-like [Leptopilina boulardi]|uniref:glucose dehydrogenase [FAD, quinone]-like n=1 Tax=Leptopilina boulardi TaxID=63433 RepID=UPI0021F53386|nr:glucose dehydrogenase [FAD, quinone]-like [Leptopilina boulardi]
MICKCPHSENIEPQLASNCGRSTLLIFMNILQHMLQQKCDIADPCGRIQSQSDINSRYDFIVIGGGSAGSPIAARLSEEKNFSVLLIEAGLDEHTVTQVPSFFRNYIGSAIDWNFTTESENQACLNAKDRRCLWPRGKVLGGSSVLTGMMYMRGSKKDYDDWEKMGNKGWSFDNVLPYFIKSEDNLQINEMSNEYHGTGGPLPVGKFPYYPPISDDILKAGKELEYNTVDLNGKHQRGFAKSQCNTKNGIRFSSARAFLRPAKNRNNLHVLLNSTVTRIIFDINKKAVAILFLQNGQLKRVSVTKEVILSAGAINSPVILLRSGVGPKKDLDYLGISVIKNLPGVGKNLHNHVSYEVAFYLNEKDTNLLNRNSINQYLKFRKGPMSGTGVTGITAMINTKYSNNSDIQLFFNGFWADCIKLKRQGKRQLSIIPTVLNAKSRGYVRLKDMNPHSKPIIVPNYFSHSDDIKTLVEGIKFSIRLSNTQALKKYGLKINTIPVKNCEEFQFGTDDYFECAIRHETNPENHQSGSCKMGPNSDPMAVVDNKLKVRGIIGVRVADASIMPQVISGNTNAPTIMIGERVADFIKEEW